MKFLTKKKNSQTFRLIDFLVSNTSVPQKYANFAPKMNIFWLFRRFNEINTSAHKKKKSKKTTKQIENKNIHFRNCLCSEELSWNQQNYVVMLSSTSFFEARKVDGLFFPEYNLLIQSKLSSLKKVYYQW